MPADRAPARRPRLLVAIQTGATVLMSLAIGQAGLAAAFLTGHRQLKEAHALNGFLLVAVTVATLIGTVLYQRQGGPRWPVLGAALLLVWEVLQITLGEFDVAGAHIFLGVLFVVLATLFTSYLFRPGFSRARQLG